MICCGSAHGTLPPGVRTRLHGNVLALRLVCGVWGGHGDHEPSHGLSKQVVTHLQEDMCHTDCAAVVIIEHSADHRLAGDRQRPGGYHNLRMRSKTPSVFVNMPRCCIAQRAWVVERVLTARTAGQLSLSLS